MNVDPSRSATQSRGDRLMTAPGVPQVSVVIPCFNAGCWIAETLAAVRSQSGVDLETVLVDDGSTDDSVAIAQAADAPSLQIVKQPNRGASEARNAGTRAARGTFIQYLDADDVLEPETLRVRVEALTRTHADVAYCDWVRWERRSDGTFAQGECVRRRLGDRPDVDLFTEAWWPPGALLYRRSLVDRILPWREDLPVIQDARFLLDAALAGGTFVHIDAVGLKYRVHGDMSLSRRDPRAFLDDIYRNAQDVDGMWQQTTPQDHARRRALVMVYAFLARSFFPLDRARFETIVERLYELEPNFLPEKPPALRAVASLVGYPHAEQVAASWRRFKRTVGLSLDQSPS